MSDIHKPFVVGITGGSASGKTFFMEKLMEGLPDDGVTKISQDNYYKPIHEIPRDSNGIENFDLPETIDHALFASHIAALKRGEDVEQKEYTFNRPGAASKVLQLKPKPVIIVEGLFIYYYPDVAQQIDLKIFVDAKEHVKIKRRIVRDNDERGYDLTDVLYRWEYHVAPTYDKFIKPLRSAADIVVNNNTTFEVALGVVLAYIHQKMDANKDSNR
jgi:uridine kinase